MLFSSHIDIRIDGDEYSLSTGYRESARAESRRFGNARNMAPERSPESPAVAVLPAERRRHGGISRRGRARPLQRRSIAVVELGSCAHEQSRRPASAALVEAFPREGRANQGGTTKGFGPLVPGI